MTDLPASPESLAVVRFQVGPWTVIPTANQLSRGDTVIHVEPKVMQVLVHLAEHAGTVVSRDALLDRVWPDVIVTEGTLSRCISQLRKALDDDARTPHIVETIPKTGYRLIASVQRPGGGDSVPGADAPAVPVAGLTRPPAPAPPRPRPYAPTRRIRAYGGGAVLVALVLGAWWILDQPAPAAPPRTFPLTSMPGVERAAAIAPDGSRVAFISHDTTGARPALSVTMMDAGPPLRLSAPDVDAAYPAWAPDGSRLAFFQCTDWSACALYTTSALGRDARRLLDGIRMPWGLSWAPDGTALAYSAADTLTHTWRLYLLDLATLTPQVLTTPPDSYRGDLDPVFSPDSRTIAFKRSRGEGIGDLYRVAVSGGPPTRLTDDATTLAGHTWSPDGAHLVFSSNRSGLFELWHLPAAGGRPERLTTVAARDPAFPVFSADGAHLVFEAWTIEVNLWEVDPLAPRTAPRRRIASTLGNSQPALSPDGETVAFLSARSGTPEVWRARRDGSDARQLTRFEGAAVGAPAWSPDGRHLAFEVYLSGQADLYVLSAEGGAPRRLTTHAGDDRTPRWSRDGRQLYFGSNRTGTWQIWTLPAEGGVARQVTETGGRIAQESADGRHLFVARIDEPGLWRVPFGGGPARQITDRLGPDDWGNWAVTDAGLYIVRRDRGRTILERLDPTTGEATPLETSLDRLIRAEPGLSASPDGRTVLYARIDRQESDLMRADFSGAAWH